MKTIDKVGHYILLAQKRLFERKAKLGEPVVVADPEGEPKVIPAAEALAELKRLHPEI